MSDAGENLLEALTGIVAVVTLPLGILAGVFMGREAAGVVFIVGWLLLVPVLGILSDHVDLGSTSEYDVDTEAVTASGDGSEDDALQRLRERYAAGDIDEVEFERRLEALLETEDVDVPARTGRESDRENRERETGIE